MNSRYSGLIHKSFEVGIFLKAGNSLLEIIGGVSLFLIRPETLNHWVALLTQHELSQDPRDLVANFLLTSAHNLSLSAKYFAGLFLLSHGVIKLFLILALFQRKLWAYPLAIIVFALFIVYQIYRYLIFHSLWMIILSVLNVFVILLTYLEYRNLET